MSTQLSFHDHKPETLSFYDAVVTGLSNKTKAIPPKLFYDEKGSKLFDLICEQPEYYPPTVERQMLTTLADDIAALTGQSRVLIEPGVGNASKVRLIMDALRPSAFVPMDISFDYLKAVSTTLAKDYPWLPVHATCVDFTHSLPIPHEVPPGKRLVFFPGSSIGNFCKADALNFLNLIHDTVGEDGMLLIGVDTKKPEPVLHAAYNDAAGITAQFNLNLLHRMRDELDAQVDLNAFEHNAFYNAQAGRIEMHLVSQQRQELRINGHRFPFDKGESVHTENSYKYAPEEFLAFSAQSHFDHVAHWVDPQGLFAIYLLKAS
ncbi:MAG TPA: L-histidine N(alpha)-methyltransferase [Gammaproteobacteria bacterium]|jgi:dimethylhistidine N-methyltransferase|nr:L-histidine N(alpha)-methyltransferase [Gammaproteobacteria bacterium]